ncbi:MAG: metallophosphoesterase family protein [Planctomycetota bacterium]|nr:metallophosphoesterase family protein [Planctomycetota bacterium]
MVSFLHTADLHLRKDRQERLEVVEHLVNVAKTNGSHILMCGDLFDGVSDANALRASVRSIQERLSPQKILLIPGNHDCDAYGDNMDYGENIIILNRKPFSELEFEGLRIVGVPFQHSTGLQNILDEGGFPPSDILLLHGTLFLKEYPRLHLEVSERKEEYFPIYAHEISSLRTRYLALGHIHSDFFSERIDGTLVCYPGSPLPVTISEIGRRSCARLSFEGGQITVERLYVDVLPYIDRLEFSLFIGKELEGQAELRRLLKSRSNPQAKMVVELKGYIGLSEYDMNDIVQGLLLEFSQEYAELHINNRTVSYKSLVEGNPLVREFVKRLEGSDEDAAVKQKSLELALQVFDELLRRG